MVERNLMTHPYSTDESRVAAFLNEAGVGGGDDPIGFLIASHRMLADQRNALRQAAQPFTACLSAAESVTVSTTGLRDEHWLALQEAAEV